MLLEARNICFGYDKKRLVLEGVSFALEAGARVGLVGSSGCGKSTLAQILAGNLPPHSGSVLFDNKPFPPKGFCPVQLIHQHPEKAVNPRWKLKEILAESWVPDDDFLTALGIEKSWLNRYPAELSGGELQRFCIARALAPRTRVIIADEISTMLDVVTQAQIWELLLRIIDQRGLSLLAITHNQALAARVCSQIVQLAGGRTLLP
ncbi:MAG: ATP-binding cassette domain-containing protein [Treponema sp.]|jgi:peptide/nickel transport system ATP-binding protein|nr:ATP-binding cassette domain-containing protein [Treponema sp.]